MQTDLPARLARRNNVGFHATCEEAEAAGFRPCKRCKPTGESIAQHQASIVAKACRIIEQSGEMPNLDDLASSAGLSAYHFIGVFKAQSGLTAREYPSPIAPGVSGTTHAAGTVTEQSTGRDSTPAAGFTSSQTKCWA